MNFIFGLQNIAASIKNTLFIFFQHQLVWGFALGFIAATAINFLILADNPRYIPHILRNQLSSDAFNKIAPQDQKGTYLISYSKFSQEHSKVRFMFYLALFAFLVVVAIALVRY